MIGVSPKVIVERHGWLLVFAVCLVLGYLLIWQRGMATDDYSFNSQVVDPVTGERRLFVPDSLDRVLHFFVDVNLAGLLPEYELFVRVLAALIAGANALLLGGLIYRLVRSRLMAAIASWLFLMPIWAYQAVLWVAAYLYIFSLFFGLLFLHACLSALSQPQRARRWSCLALLCYAIAIGFGEQAALTAVCVPVLALALAAQGRIAGVRVAITRSLPLLVAPLILAAGLVIFGYGSSDMVATRGGMDPTASGLAERTGTFANRLVQLTIRPNTGLRLVNESFRRGARALLTSPAGMALFIAAGFLLLLTVIFWQGGRKEERMSGRTGLAFIALCICWIGVTILFPGVTLARQALTSRMLYIPLAGAAVLGAVVAHQLARRIPGPAGERIMLLLAGSVLLTSTVCMLGYARAYQARYQLDQRQITALIKVLPAGYLPDADPYIIAFELDERLFTSMDGLSQSLIGAMQTAWSARDIFQRAYRRLDIRTVAPVGWLIKPIVYTPAQAGTPAVLKVLNIPVPIDKTVFFVYKDGAAHPIESFAYRQGDGVTLTVRFPLVEKMRADGLPALTNYPASEMGKTFAGEIKGF